jgi:hypothetical protein
MAGSSLWIVLIVLTLVICASCAVCCLVRDRRFGLFKQGHYYSFLTNEVRATSAPGLY